MKIVQGKALEKPPEQKYFNGVQKKDVIKIESEGTAMVVRWLRLCPPSPRGTSSIPGQGLRSRTLRGVARTTSKGEELLKRVK